MLAQTLLPARFSGGALAALQHSSELQLNSVTADLDAPRPQHPPLHQQRLHEMQQQQRRHHRRLHRMRASISGTAATMATATTWS